MDSLLHANSARILALLAAFVSLFYRAVPLIAAVDIWAEQDKFVPKYTRFTQLDCFADNQLSSTTTTL